MRITGLCLDQLRQVGMYWREHTTRDGQLWDVISDAPMATEFANSRFLVPHLAKGGWAVFLDADMLARADLAHLFNLGDKRYAVQVVKHEYAPTAQTKMDGQLQTVYPRKNWSSLMLFNCDHPANRRLTIEMVNTLPGRDLHAFCWLDKSEIGALPPEWNWLAGHSSPEIDPALVHYTTGGPWLPAYADAPYSNEWRTEYARWAA
jgi:lipopolysaccharide biosynthesis glycosyltransferase